MLFKINNFAGASPLEVHPMQTGRDKLVLIVQNAGAMHFQHTMTPEQARYMAAALQMAAEEAEAMAASTEAQP